MFHSFTQSREIVRAAHFAAAHEKRIAAILVVTGLDHDVFVSCFNAWIEQQSALRRLEGLEFCYLKASQDLPLPWEDAANPPPTQKLPGG